jgi:hypothetical protein
MDKKFQVFVSSTYTDMQDERQAVVSEILEAGHIPAGMELFAAGDKTMLETIKRWINDSDIFLLILGGRYGSIEPESGKSYIEVEYEYAKAIDKPYFAAVMEEDLLDQKVASRGKAMLEREHIADYDRFKAAVMSKSCGLFTNMDQLKLIVSHSLHEIERTRDLVGWVRGDTAANPAPLIEQIGNLQRENDDLRKQLGDAKAQLPSEERYTGYEFNDLCRRLAEITIDIPANFHAHYKMVTIPLLTLFWIERWDFSMGFVNAPGAPKQAWLVSNVLHHLVVFGLVDIGHALGSPFGGQSVKTTDAGRVFLSRLNREEKLRSELINLPIGFN